jgi:hypothetical protein
MTEINEEQKSERSDKFETLSRIYAIRQQSNTDLSRRKVDNLVEEITTCRGRWGNSCR